MDAAILAMSFDSLLLTILCKARMASAADRLAISVISRCSLAMLSPSGERFSLYLLTFSLFGSNFSLVNSFPSLNSLLLKYRALRTCRGGSFRIKLVVLRAGSPGNKPPIPCLFLTIPFVLSPFLGRCDRRRNIDLIGSTSLMLMPCQPDAPLDDR